MAWHDDSWKDSYDSWKLASPDDEREDECLHEDYEADVLGRATCCRCSHLWWMTDDEIKWERERSEAYDRIMRRADRRERVRQILDKVRRLWRWRKPSPIDEEIPF
jgi:hypothetical protein